MNKISNIVASTVYGSMIVNRFDYLKYKKPWGEDAIDGVGYEILETSTYEPDEVNLTSDILRLHAQYFPGNLLALDIGANIGVYTIAWSKVLLDLKNSGIIIAVEPQEWVYYMLAGNIAINNRYNARAVMAAISDEAGVANIPRLDYRTPASFGSLRIETEVAVNESYSVPKITIDGMGFERLDLLKIDVEGMEIKVLGGAEQTIQRCRPTVLIEFFHTPEIIEWFKERNYWVEQTSHMNVLCVPNESPIIPHLHKREEIANVSS